MESYFIELLLNHMEGIQSRIASNSPWIVNWPFLSI